MALVCPWECCCAHITHNLQFLMHPIILEYFTHWKTVPEDAQIGASTAYTKKFWHIFVVLTTKSNFV